MASIKPVTVDTLSLGSVRGTLGSFSSTGNNDYWVSGIPGIIMVVPMSETGSAMNVSWTASSGTIFFKNVAATTSLTALVLSKSF